MTTLPTFAECAAVPPDICGKCQLPMYPSEAARHFGWYSAHLEDRCIALLRAAIEEERKERDALAARIAEQDAQIESLQNKWATRPLSDHDCESYTQSLEARCDALAAENERLRLLIETHNTGCELVCGVGEQAGVACGYRPYFPRRCPDCPRDWMIDIDAKEPTT